MVGSRFDDVPQDAVHIHDLAVTRPSENRSESYLRPLVNPLRLLRSEVTRTNCEVALGCVVKLSFVRVSDDSPGTAQSTSARREGVTARTGSRMNEQPYMGSMLLSR